MGCGVLGILPEKGQPLALEKILAVLDNMKNRGDDGTGLLFLKEKARRFEKWAGNAQDIPEHTFDNLMNDETARMPEIVLGHARYATKGKIVMENNQPAMASKGNAMVALAMNGEISFTGHWNEEAREKGIDLHRATSDAAHSAGKILAIYLEKKDIAETLKEFYLQAFPFGGFTFLGALCDGEKKHFFYMRDGLRPLHFAKAAGSLVFFSETSHANCLGVQEIREVGAGEAGFIEPGTLKWSRLDMNRELKGTASRGLCPFEVTYFQNYDSKIDGITVDFVRREFGKKLAIEHPPKPGAVVSWVPKSGISATQGYFEEALKNGGGIEFRQVLTRMPDSRARGERSFLGYKSLSLQEKLARKFKINAHDVKGEHVIVIDDSIVRGSVSQWIAKMLNAAKPKSLSFMAAWPPMVGECRAGIDIERGELIALAYFGAREVVGDQQKLEKKLEECFACRKCKCKKLFDSVSYVSVDSVKEVLGKYLKGKACTGCFEGNYSYIHRGNLENPPAWLVEFIAGNSVELPEEVKI